MIGQVFGPYRVLAKLGEGGMGEVYCARDTKLDREVALKILPAELAGDPERLARFEREAKTLAALNHPHIAQVYGLEDVRSAGASAPASSALVMELVPGESLAARLARGPLPLREALDLARQIADGLEAAREKGIVHRDLKPANVHVTPDGKAKILDFGLAKAVAAPGPEGPGLRRASEGRGSSPGARDSDDATLISPAHLRHGAGVHATQPGLILGTAAYMSPEQARGLPVDARTDVWAFGGVLFEMLTGARPFPGPTVTDLLAQILERDPDWTKLPATTPAPVRALIQRCLRKEPKQRLHDIADARFILEDALAALSAGASGVGLDASGIGALPAPPPARAVWRHPLSLALALLTLALGGALAWSLGRTPVSPPREPTYLSLTLPPGQERASGTVGAISPDGLDIIYAAVTEEGPPGAEGNVSRLYHRRLTEPTARALPGTEGAVGPGDFSPDGAWVAFVSPADRKLKKIALAGGGPVEVADLPAMPDSPVTWIDEGAILVGDPTGALWRMPATGGQPEVLVPRSALEGGEHGTRWPVALPGGRVAIFETQGSASAHNIVAWVDGKRRTLFKDAYAPRLSPTGHLLFSRRASSTAAGGNLQVDLLAVALDPVSVETSGTPVALLSEPAPRIAYDMSSTGTLLYSRSFGGEYRDGRFAWLARDGRPLPPRFPSPRPERVILTPRVSPDGRHVLYLLSGGSGQTEQLTIVDVATGVARVLVTGSHYWAAWTPDGRRVIYQDPLDDEGFAGMSWKPADSGAAPLRLTRSKSWQQPQMVTRDGRYLVYQESGGIGTRDASLDDNYDLWLLPLEPRGEPRPLLKTAANEHLAHVSPDGRWMAYASDETGRDEVWVRAFPEGAAVMQVSQDGGTEPLWAPDGGTLYYRDAAGGRLFTVPVIHGPVPQFGAPVVTSGHWVPGRAYGRMYDVAQDGSLLMLPAPTFGRELKLVLNFDEVIRRKMAGAQGGRGGTQGTQ